MEYHLGTGGRGRGGRRWSSSRSPESALMAASLQGFFGTTAAGLSLVPRDAAASGTCGRRGLRGS